MGKSAYIPFDRISLPKLFNPRPEDDDGFEIQRMNFIFDDIREHGLNAALIVTPIEKGKEFYNVIAGERRYRSISKLIANDVMCFDPVTETKKPAKEIYLKIGVECKIQFFANEVERKIAAIHENVLHEPLSDFALLRQLQWLKDNGVSQPAEQGKILARSAAWISQSHNLLRPEKKKLIDYIKEHKLSRTAALNFINIPDDEIDKVLDTAMKDATRAWEQKVEEASVGCKHSAEEIGKNKAVLTLASFMGDPSENTLKSARNNINQAKRSYSKNKKTLDRADEGPSLTDTDVVNASRTVGAAKGLRKGRPAAELRKKFSSMKEDGCVEGMNEAEFRGAMAMARWMLDCSGPDNVAELLNVVDE